MTNFDYATAKVSHVELVQIHPRVVKTVPVAEIFDAYENAEKPSTIEAAIVTDAQGNSYRTFAGAWTVWDFAALKHRVVYIGLGAGHERSKLSPYNEAVRGQKVTQHYTHGEWVSGINWDTRAAEYR